MGNILYIVIPCYNEQEVLGETASRLENKFMILMDNKIISNKSRIMFVNDGSKDDTWNIIMRLHKQNKIFMGINLSRNEGHQNALVAGLMTAKAHADMVISMDADLQDDINAIDEMINHYQNGIDIVYGIRSARKKDTYFKRLSAECFYRLMGALGAETVFNHADYRLMSRRAIEGLEKFKEVNLFLRGIVPLIGYKTAVVYYERAERFAGESKYPLKKMLSFAIEGITSLSIKPIRFITLLGLMVSAFSIVILFYSLYRHYLGDTIIGWTTTILSIWAIGGLLLFSIGIIGEYIGKIYLETKQRPRYIIETILEDKGDLL